MNRLETHKHVQIKEHLRKNTPKCPGIPSLPPTSTNKSRDVYKIIPQSFLGCQLHTGGIWGTLGDAPSMKSWQCPQLPGHTSSPPSKGPCFCGPAAGNTPPHLPGKLRPTPHIPSVVSLPQRTLPDSPCHLLTLWTSLVASC